MGTGDPRVAICVATFRRPDGLRRLLESLDALALTRHSARLEVVVVDNDPNASGLRAVGGFEDGLDVLVRAVHEQRPGIPQARNAAIAAAEDADFLAFVDDDEIVDPGWLDELLHVADAYDADVVVGPVIPELPTETPQWIVRGGFFERPRFPTGTSRPYAATNNVLVDAAVFVEVGGFDHRLALTGGSDRELFDRVVAAGFTIVWADDAIVREIVPRERLNARWLLRRSYRLGNEIGVRLRLRRAPPHRYVYEVGFACARGLFGALIAVSGLVRGRHTLVQGLRSIAAAVGTIAGISGRIFEEYRR